MIETVITHINKEKAIQSTEFCPLFRPRSALFPFWSTKGVL